MQACYSIEIISPNVSRYLGSNWWKHHLKAQKNILLDGSLQYSKNVAVEAVSCNLLDGYGRVINILAQWEISYERL